MGSADPTGLHGHGRHRWADTDIDAAMAEDEQVAEELDREQDARLAHVRAVAARA